MKAKKAKQKWEPGKKVNIGGRDYVLKHQEAKPRAKGEAAPWILETLDGTRRYSWVPFRGLRPADGQELVRPRRHRAKAGNGGALPDSGLLSLIVEDIRDNPRPNSKQFLTKVLGYFGVDMADSGKPAKEAGP